MAKVGRDEARRLGDERLLSHIADTEAQIAFASGDVKAADALCDEAIDLADRTGNNKALLDALTTKARVAMASDRGDAALALYERAGATARSVGPASRRREVLGAWADALAKLGRHDQAYELMREAMQGGR